MTPMLSLLFTLDYEIHGNGDGCSHELMVEPTDRMLRLFDRYGAKLTIMADVAEILKFREYQQLHGRDDYHYAAIAEQLRRAIQTGHDVQLHLHSSYFNSRHEHGCWIQDWSEYSFADLPYERMNYMIRTGKEYLEDLLRPVNSSYRCLAFRAANWSVSPARNLVRALVQNQIQIDSSVFKYGKRNGIVQFDYSHAHGELGKWPAREDDLCVRDERGPIWEAPIYSEKRWIGAFLSANRVFRAFQGRLHPVKKEAIRTEGPSKASVRPKSKLSRGLSIAISRHAWKADFNQCTGRQLIHSLKRAIAKIGNSERVPFVLIGHSKLFTPSNERSLKPFLAYAANLPGLARFGTFPEVLQDSVSKASSPMEVNGK